MADDNHEKESQGRVLVVDDEQAVRKTLKRILEGENFTVITASSGNEALNIAEKEPLDAVLLDLRMPGISGMETLRELRRLYSGLPVIVVTANNDIQTAVTAIKLGAEDFLLKPPDFDMLIIMLRKSLEKRDLQRKLEILSTEMGSSMTYLLGKSPAMKRLIGQMHQISQSNFSVLIEGETGTGKTFAARILHNLSKQKSGPFVSVDIGAIPETLIESELFGYEKGAFTGAEKRKRGFFEMASGGTIVIDELQNMSAHVQGKLLGIVEEKCAYPLGSSNPVRVDVRIVGLTNVDLKEAMEKKLFRNDLYYRLTEVVISIPPLRERREDIPFFVQKFLSETCEELAKPKPEISEDALNLLLEYPWPGNVRELRNIVRRIVLFFQGATIERENVECFLGATEKYEAVFFSPSAREIPLMTMKQIEEIMIRRVLLATGGNKTKAASILQIDYKTLLRKIAHYGI